MFSFSVLPLRNHLLQHLCDRKTCLSCELGFLFRMLFPHCCFRKISLFPSIPVGCFSDMLDISRGGVATTSKLFAGLRQIPEATALGLLDLNFSLDVMGARAVEPPQRGLHSRVNQQSSSLLTRIQDLDRYAFFPCLFGVFLHVISFSFLLRFLLEHLNKEALAPAQAFSFLERTSPFFVSLPIAPPPPRPLPSSSPSIFESLFGVTVMQQLSCLHGKHHDIKESRQFHVRLQYPPSRFVSSRTFRCMRFLSFCSSFLSYFQGIPLSFLRVFACPFLLRGWCRHSVLHSSSVV